ncbi:MAG: BspA family leucine-rich repeat surface protein [Bacilli bacterium]
MNKYKLYMIFGIVLLGLSITGSLAYYIWSSSTTSISGNLCLPEIYFTGGTTINSKLKPVSSKEEGLIKEIEVNLHKTCNNDTAVMNLYLSLDLLPTALQENTFVYELYNGNNERISSGNFSNKKQGDIITLAENEIVTSNVSIYTLYIYIDSNRDNPITMTNQNFRFNIYGEGTGAIYKENVIQNETTRPSSSSSTFLNTEVLRNQIESITIEKNNIVPSDAKYSKDISSKQDGSVMLWYTDKDNNNLYEVSIGGKNGSVEANTIGSGMFAYLENVDTLDLTGLDTSNTTDMSHMFRDSKKLTSLDLSNFNTFKVIYMNNMFYNCTSLTKLNLNSFDTSKVVYMNNMFYNCTSLSKLDLNSFTTSKVTTMLGMFNSCKKLSYIDLSGFNTSKVTNMQSMFYNCEKLENIDLSNFDSSNVTNMSYMFDRCSNLTSLDVSTFDTSKVTNMNTMFAYCNVLETIYVSNKWNTSNVTSFNNMFLNCTSLTGAVPFDSTKTDVSMANYTNGYLTYKASSN